jgi:ribosomal protein L7/L12
MAPQDSEIQELISAGRKIEAIRIYRERYGVGLKEAKEAVEALERGESPTWAPSPSSSRLSEDPAFASTIDASLRKGQLLQAIKQYRDRYPVGLKEAKEIIEARARELGPAVGSERAMEPAQSGKGFFNCSTIILLIVALGWFIYRTAVGW